MFAAAHMALCSPSSDRGMLLVLVIVIVIVIEYRARSGSLSGFLALTLNPAAAGRGGNRTGTVLERSYDNDNDDDNEYKNDYEHDYGFSITGLFWSTCNSVPPPPITRMVTSWSLPIS